MGNRVIRVAGTQVDRSFSEERARIGGSSGNARLTETSTGFSEHQVFEAELEHHLLMQDLTAARTLVAHAEGRLIDMPEGSSNEKRAMIGVAKARIAMATGDLMAAHAVLVVALERYGPVGKLKGTLTEVMLAAGNASDVRPVLHHLSPSEPMDVESVGRTTSKVGERER